MALRWLCIGGLWAALAVAAPAETAGQITAVRAYRGQALVTRQVTFNAAQGAQELTVSELPTQVQPASLYATADEGVVIRGVRLVTTAVREEPRDEARKLDTQIREVELELRQIQSDLQVVTRQNEYLDKIENFVAVTAQGDNAKGVLNPQSLIEVTKFAFEQRQTLATKELQYQTKLDDAKERLSVLQRERQKLMGGNSRTRRDAVIFLEAAQAGPARLELNYLVGGVNWAPAYIARLNANHDQLSLEYHAVVTQVSGEDWPAVELTLSTSHPNMVADAPSLSPLWISLASLPQAGRADKPAMADAREYQLKRRALESQIKDQAANAPAQVAMQPQAERPTAAPGMVGGGGAMGPSGALPTGTADESLLSANLLAAQLQNLELSASEEAVREARRLPDANALAADYAMEGKVTLQSRNDPQMLRIATIEMPAEFYYTAVPLLSDYVYQAIEVTNSSDYPLLSGPFNAYVGAAFAGRGTVPMTARGQSLKIGFGTETRLRATRTLLTKGTEIRGGNQQLTYTYEIRLQNFMDQPATIRIWDRLPQPPDKQVAVTLTEAGPPLSEDKLYVEQERPRGLLRWDVEVPAHAARAEAHTFKYAYQLEFDKNYQIGELPAATLERIKQDFQTMQELRMQ